MTTINDVCEFLDSFAPLRLAEDWDNVGLLVGDRAGQANQVMTCLTITPNSADEAIRKQADLIVSHHPLPFRSLKRLTTDVTASRLLWDLIRAGVSIYSPHTAFDSAAEGINQSLAQRLKLTNIKPLVPHDEYPDGLGSGRLGKLAPPQNLSNFTQSIKSSFEIERLSVVRSASDHVEKVGVACGSGGSFLQDARKAGCDTLVTGEATFHTCLEAQALGIRLVLLGHYASERFAVESLATRIQRQFPTCGVWSSENESDPVELV